MAKNKINKIVWSVDPIEDDKAVSAHTLDILKALSKKMKAKIEPVYVLSDGLLGLSVPKSALVNQFREPSQRALKNFVKNQKLSNLGEGSVVISAPSSRSKAAHDLDRFAQAQGADLIVVSSHGRKGLKRAVMGSFAETLTLQSKTPVLITGPKNKTIKSFDHILFPTDFSKASKKAFDEVQSFAKKMGARVTLFYAILNTVDPFIQSGVGLLGGGYVSTRGYLNQASEKQRKMAKEWVDEAKKNGVNADFDFDEDSTSVTRSILHYADRNKISVIAMASESGAVSAAVLGSIGRSVARDAECPVWFLRG